MHKIPRLAEAGFLKHGFAPRVERGPSGGEFFNSMFTPRAEHSLLFRKKRRGKQRVFTAGDNFTPGANFTPGVTF
jgi:hypothetical protein